jgi:LmbE family N-acetylglucosaminyl deacetylase
MNVLVIAPHPDDESIGCGGAICLHADQGHRVTTVFLTSGEYGLRELAKEAAWRVREREAERAAKILGVASVEFLRRPDQYLEEDISNAARALKPILQREKPEVLYLTHERDFHPDHRATVPIVRTAVHAAGIAEPTLLSYEVLTPLTEFDRAEDISLVMQRKLKAMRAHRSQIRQFRYDLAFRAMNRYRGVMAQSGRYAEVFRVAGENMSGISLPCRADPGWHRFYTAAQEIAEIIPTEAAFILPGEAISEVSALVAPRHCIPLLEKAGGYWGKPADDAAAIRELERQRESGASFIVFVSSTFWWLEYYAGLREYLRARFPCVRENDRIVMFDLRKAAKVSIGLTA